MMMAGMLTIIFLVNGIKQWLKKAKASRGLNKFLTLLACFLLPTIIISIIIYAGIAIARSDFMNQKLVANDTVPLSVADFMEVKKDQYVVTNDQHHTFLLGQMNVDAFPHWDLENRQDFPDLRYDITIVKVPFLYDWCKDQMYRDLDETDDTGIPAGHRLVYVEQDSAPWGANEVYRLYQEEGWYMDWYLLCYEDRIVEIRFDWEPTEEQMAIVGQKLNP